MNNILLIDKPAGWTSFDVVAKLRGALRAKYKATDKTLTKKQLRIGHSGTLDPFATGLLIILLGDECKKADKYLKLDKTYEFTAKLGEISTTGDPEGTIQAFSAKRIALKEVEVVLEQFKGVITQRPPGFSAIKVGGQRAYKLARAGMSVEIPAREVTVHDLQLTEYEYPYLKCVCDVSSGTYIRTLVEDIGKKLGTGAYCQELRRTQVGDYHINNSMTVDEATRLISED